MRCDSQSDVSRAVTRCDEVCQSVMTCHEVWQLVMTCHEGWRGVTVSDEVWRGVTRCVSQWWRVTPMTTTTTNKLIETTQQPAASYLPQLTITSDTQSTITTLLYIIFTIHSSHRLRGSASTVLTASRQAKSMGDGKFWPLTDRNPCANCHKIPHNWLCPREDPLNQIWYKSIHRALLGKWVNYNVFVPFSVHLFSKTRVQVRPFDGLLRAIAQ